MFLLLFEKAGFGVAETDLKGSFLSVSSNLCKMFGYSEEEALGKNYLEFTHPEDAKKSLIITKKFKEDGFDNYQFEQRCLHKGGKIIWVRFTGVLIRNDGVPSHFFSIIENITDSKIRELSIVKSEERLRLSLNAANAGIWEWEPATGNNYWSKELWNIFEKTPSLDNLENTFDFFLTTIRPEDRRRLKKIIFDQVKENKEIRFEWRVNRTDDIEQWAISVGKPEFSFDNILRYYGVIIDITQRVKMEQQLYYDATHDSLTGLSNRAEFNRELHAALRDAKENDKKHVLCYLDLDQFKIVNDSAGHIAGDRLLKQLGELIPRYNLFKKADTFARIGGDEFALLLINCSIDEAKIICQKIIDNINNYRFEWESISYKIGISIGIVTITNKSSFPEVVLSQADVACYTAKEQGRNRFEIYSEYEEGESYKKYAEISLLSKLTGFIEKNSFFLLYQPIVPIFPFEREEHYEALIRIKDNGNILYPSDFISASERYGIITIIDKWVVHNIFSSYKDNFEDRIVEISINVSAASMAQTAFIEYVEKEFVKFQIPYERICFEITETATVLNQNQIIQFMNRMKSLGCKISLDDFGIGMASFGYLKTMPISYLKIDGSFIKNIVTDKKDKAIVATISSLSKSYEIKTVAEFVENEEIIDVLKELKIDYAQGYYLGKPKEIIKISLKSNIEERVWWQKNIMRKIKNFIILMKNMKKNMR